MYCKDALFLQQFFSFDSQHPFLFRKGGRWRVVSRELAQPSLVSLTKQAFRTLASNDRVFSNLPTKHFVPLTVALKEQYERALKEQEKQSVEKEGWLSTLFRIYEAVSNFFGYPKTLPTVYQRLEEKLEAEIERRIIKRMTKEQSYGLGELEQSERIQLLSRRSSPGLSLLLLQSYLRGDPAPKEGLLLQILKSDDAIALRFWKNVGWGLENLENSLWEYASSLKSYHVMLALVKEGVPISTKQKRDCGNFVHAVVQFGTLEELELLKESGFHFDQPHEISSASSFFPYQMTANPRKIDFAFFEFIRKKSCSSNPSLLKRSVECASFKGIESLLQRGTVKNSLAALEELSDHSLKVFFHRVFEEFDSIDLDKVLCPNPKFTWKELIENLLVQHYQMNTNNKSILEKYALKLYPNDSPKQMKVLNSLTETSYGNKN